MECSVDYTKLAKALRMLCLGFSCTENGMQLLFKCEDLKLLEEKRIIYVFYKGKKIKWKKINRDWQKFCDDKVINRFSNWLGISHVVDESFLAELVKESSLGEFEDIIDKEAWDFCGTKKIGNFRIDNIYVQYELNWNKERFIIVNAFDEHGAFGFDSYGERSCCFKKILNSFKFGLRRGPKEVISYLKECICDRSEKWVKEYGM